MATKEKSAEVVRKEFGNWLKNQRKMAGLTQEDVARNAPIDRVHLARIEGGDSGTKRDTAISIVETINRKSVTGHKVDMEEALDRFYGRWKEDAINDGISAQDLEDDELVKDGVFSGYYELDEEKRKLARKQIAAIIRTLKDEDFPE